MKKILLTILLILISGLFQDTYATGDGCPSGYGTKGKDFCYKIRVGDKRYFSDIFYNPNDFPLKIKKKEITFSTDGYNYNGGSIPKFDWTNWLKTRKGILGAKERGTIIESSPSYEIKYRPEKRSLKNLTIIYDIDWMSYYNNEEHPETRKTHTEIAHYEITWCGDGVRDPQFGEVCDPLDPNKEGFGNIGCSTDCRAVNGNLCGNGKKESNEQCDPADPSHNGWGNKGCSETCKALSGPVCDQVFQNKLRYGKAYIFGDYFKNKTNQKLKIKNVGVNFKERFDFNGTTTVPFYKIEDDLKNRNFIFSAYEEGKLVSSTMDTKYGIVHYPGDGRNDKYDDVNIVYTTKYTKYIDGKEKGYYMHSECDNYEITWCGDGVIDNYTQRDGLKIHEECDPNAINPETGEKFGPATCDVITCERIEVPEPVCNELNYQTTKNPIKIGTDNTTKQVSCKATNAETIKIDCGNGDTQEFSGNKTGEKTVTKSCTYTTAGTYVPKCFINNTITSNSCKKSLTVTNPTPKIEIIKSDNNADDKDGIVGNDTQTVVKGDKAIFKITVKNIGGEDLKEVVITDPVEPSCNRTAKETKALYSGDVFKVGDIFTYNCEKTNTQNDYTNTANVSAIGIISNENVDDTDPTVVRVVVPSCTNLTATPNEGDVTFISNFVCTAENANDYKIEIKDSNGNIIKTINNNSGEYNFSNEGEYTATCYINNRTSTEQACIKTIKANKSPVPSIVIDKTDDNIEDRDNNISDTQTVYKGDKAVFKITVTNNGNEDLTNVIVTDPKAPDCNRTETETKALYSGDVFKIGDSFTYSCEKNNTIENYTNTIFVTADGVSSGKDVNSNDPTDVKIVEPVCTGLNIDKISGKVSFVSKFTCTGDNVDTYKIEIKNSDGNVIKTINSNVGEYNFTNSGEYSVECYMNNETETEDVCRKIVTANENTNPSIEIDKTDSNENLDNDGIVGNDTQTVKNGDKAVFRIKVTNNGTSDLKNIVLTDEVAPNCAGSVTLNGTYPSTFKDFTISGAGNHNDEIFQPGEIFEYTCEKSNTVSDYTNTATVKAESTTDNQEVEDTDTTNVKTGVYDLALKKVVLLDTSTFKKGEIVEFEISVFNQGTIDAHDVTVVDYIPTALELKDNSWTKVGNKAIRNIGDIEAGKVKSVTITFKVLEDDQKVINWSEIKSTSDDYIDVDSTPDDNNENDCHGGKDRTEVDSNSDDRLDGNGDSNNNGTCEAGEDEDDHDPAVIDVISKNPKIKIEKYSNQGETDQDTNKDKNPADDSQTINSGETSKFTIKVTNTGDEDLKDLVITDELAPNCDKTFVELKIGESETYTCTDENITENYTNVAKVVAKGKTTNVDVSDEDDTKVVIVGENDSNVCQATITGSQSSAITENTDGLCKNSDETVVDFTKSVSGRTTTYTWGCKDSNNVVYTGGNCSASYTTKGGGGGGASGSDPKCYDIKNSGNDFTCIVNKKTYTSGTVGIDCDRDGVYEQVATEGNGLERDSNGRYVATFTCSGVKSDGTTYEIKPQCNVQRGVVLPDQTAGWGLTSSQCKYLDPLTTYCGDGVVQNPNSNGEKEECDLGSKNGSNSACSSNCKLNAKEHTFTPNCNNSIKYYDEHKDICGSTTRPSAGELEITSVSNFAIGNGQQVFKNQGSYYEFNTDNINNKALFIKNIGDEPMYFDDYLCLFDRGNKEKIEYTDSDYNGDNQNILSGNNSYCENDSIGFLYPGEIKYLDVSDLEDIKGNTNSFSEKIKTSHLVLTVKNGGATYDWSPILAGQIYVTVAKPTIASQGGGTTYLANNNISNVNKIAETVASHNNGIDAAINTNQNNFISTVLGSGSNLSNVDTIDDTKILEKAEEESTDLEEEAKKVVEKITFIGTKAEITSLDDFASYRGIENVVSVRDTNVTLSKQNLSENKTYIIENGDLIIEGNIESTKNIAFIVKNGDIIIKNNVTQIDGTYVNIGGKIKSENTSNELTVNGSLYGDLSELTSNRTHISMDVEGNINVGTIISFGSNVLNKPAPLVGQFIGEYMDSKKIAQ